MTAGLMILLYVWSMYPGVYQADRKHDMRRKVIVRNHLKLGMFNLAHEMRKHLDTGLLSPLLKLFISLRRDVTGLDPKMKDIINASWENLITLYNSSLLTTDGEFDWGRLFEVMNFNFNAFPAERIDAFKNMYQFFESLKSAGAKQKDLELLDLLLKNSVKTLCDRPMTRPDGRLDVEWFTTIMQTAKSLPSDISYRFSMDLLENLRGANTDDRSLLFNVQYKRSMLDAVAGLALDNKEIWGDDADLEWVRNTDILKLKDGTLKLLPLKFLLTHLLAADEEYLEDQFDFVPDHELSHYFRLCRDELGMDEYGKAIEELLEDRCCPGEAKITARRYASEEDMSTTVASAASTSFK